MAKARSNDSDVLWIGPWAANSLSAQVRSSIANAIRARGVSLDTVVYGEVGSWREGGFDRIHYLSPPRTMWGKLTNQIRMLILIARFRGKMLVLGERVAHFSPIAKFFRAALMRRWKIHVDIRTLPIPDTAGMQEWRFWAQVRVGLGSADGWSAITKRLEAVVRQRVPVSEIPFTVWESAADRGFLDVKITPPSDNSRGGTISLLYLGSLVAGRWIECAIDGVAQVSPRGSVTLTIIGDGPHRPQLEEYVTRHGLNEIVFVRDAVAHRDVPRTIAEFDAGVLPLPPSPAWDTSSPLKIFEYLAIGCPVIVSPIPAHVDVLANHNFAFVMRDFTPEAFRQAVEDFAQLSLQERAELSDAARAFIAAGHTWDHRAAIIIEFWRTLSHGWSELSE